VSGLRSVRRTSGFVLADQSPRTELRTTSESSPPAKVERSGLKEYFSAVEVLAEKNAPTYREIVSKYQLAPEMTWMLALAAGINAVFVPHDSTWTLEHETVNPAPEGCRLLGVNKFADLQSYF
jgi:putative hydrolase of the HAD superfamily